MYTAILVDDEPWAIEGLKNIINWEEYGCRIIGTYDDGIDAWNAVLEEKPDFIFTDIRMPNFSGTDLVHRLRDAGIDSEIVIISAYRDFAVAQDAMLQRVDSYITKPLKRPVIQETVLRLIGKRQNRKDSRAVPGPRNEENCSNEQIKEAQNYLKLHLRDNLTVEDVAKHVHMSESYLYELFKKTVGVTVMQYLRDLRLKKAIWYMQNSSMSIAEIAEQVGYPDNAYFCRVFKKVYDCSPERYRKAILAQGSEE